MVTVNPLLLFQTHLREGGLHNLAKTMVSVFHKRTITAKCERSSTMVVGHAAEDQKQI